MVYDEREDMCYSVEGGICTLRESSDDDIISCLEGLTCVEVPGKYLTGKCTLKEDSAGSHEGEESGGEVGEEDGAMETTDNGEGNTGEMETTPGMDSSESTEPSQTGEPGDGTTPPEGPGTDRPGTDGPGTDDPITEDPGAGGPGTDDPITEDPGTGGPGPGGPTTGDPGSTTRSTTPEPDSGTSLVASVLLLVLAQIVLFS